MSVREYLQLLRHGKWWIAGGLLLGMLGGLLIALTTVPSYVATTTLYFAAIEGGGEPGQAYQGALLAEQKARAYAQLIVSDRLLNEVRNDTDGPCRSGCGPVPASAITVQSSAGNPTLIVKVTDPSAQRAAKVADTIAEKTANLVADLERPRDPVLSTVTTLRTLAPAAVPTTPASPNLKVDVLVGAVIGTILGLSVAVVRRSLDRSVRTREALEELTGLPLLGTIPYDKPSRRTPSLIPDRPHGQVAEAVRQLRVNIRSAGTGSCTSLLVTSAVAGEGKTSLVCNLAAAFGLEGDRVLLIDADLRRPSVGNYLGINPTSGLSAVLLGERQPHDAVESWRNGLFDVLTSGPIPENPSELLGSKRTSVMLTELESRYDVVLIDSPALLPVADGSVLARACDAALLVVRHGQTPASEITDALAELRAVSARVLGCAFSMEPQPSRTFRSRTDYSPIQEADRERRRRTFYTAGQTTPYEEVRHPERSERAWNEVLETGEVDRRPVDMDPHRFTPLNQNAARSEHNGPPMDSIGFSQSSLVAVNQNGDATVELLSGPATEEALTTETDEQVSSASESSARRSQPSPVPRTDATPSKDGLRGKHASGSRDDDGEPGARRPSEARRSRSVTDRDAPPRDGWSIET